MLKSMLLACCWLLLYSLELESAITKLDMGCNDLIGCHTIVLCSWSLEQVGVLILKLKISRPVSRRSIVVSRSVR
jgi:hypothetical protein